jgi:outer membrane protein assembly factor BamB
VAGLLVLARYLAPPFAGEAEIFGRPVVLIGILAGLAGAAAIVLWWLLFSRAAWVERIGAIVLMIAGFVSLRFAADVSISRGMAGAMLMLYAVPPLALALVAWAAATRNLATSTRRVTLVITIVLACLPWALVRSAGVMGIGAEFHWRWTPTPEERLLSQEREDPRPAPQAQTAGRAPDPPAPSTASTEPAASTKGALAQESTRAANASRSEDPPPHPKDEPPAEWPGFRGSRRDAVVRGLQIATDWSSSPPTLIWRRPVGPGWSSFAIRRGLIYTQEQRGEDEAVSCYRLRTGEPVWRHRDRIRFWESEGGAGPRATPTVQDGRVYTMGATGLVNAFDADSGTKIWSRNAATDAEKQVPEWGFASSPLVVDGLVIVGVSGRLAAYDTATGAPRWLGPTGGGGYSSPHFALLHGIPQVVLLRGPRTISVAPADGTLLWEYSTGKPTASIVQPVITDDGDVLISEGDNAMIGDGIRRVAVTRTEAGWTTEERWMSRGLKPAFNDYVIHEGHAYGFDGTILSAIDLTDGSRKWKGGRYGNGQLVLLPDQDLLLVLSEEGELALVSATPDKYTELARMPAITGKTWNHPAIAGDILLVRNAEEMAAFRLPLVRQTTAHRHR